MVDRYESIRQEKLDEADAALEYRTYVACEVQDFVERLKAEKQFAEKGVTVIDAYDYGPHIRS